MYEIGMQVEVTFQNEDGEDEVASGVIIAPLMPVGAWVRLEDGDKVLSEQENIHVK